MPQPISRNDWTVGKVPLERPDDEVVAGAEPEVVGLELGRARSKYSTRNPSLPVARSGANAREPARSTGRCPHRRRPRHRRSGRSRTRGRPSPAAAARPDGRWNVIWADANVNPSRAYRLMTGRLWPEMVVSTEVAPSSRWRGAAGPPDARAHAPALPLGRDRGEVPVHARVRRELDDEEPTSSPSSSALSTVWRFDAKLVRTHVAYRRRLSSGSRRSSSRKRPVVKAEYAIASIAGESAVGRLARPRSHGAAGRSRRTESTAGRRPSRRSGTRLLEGHRLAQPGVVEPARDQPHGMLGAPALEGVEGLGRVGALGELDPIDLRDRKPEDLRVPRHERALDDGAGSLEPRSAFEAHSSSVTSRTR